MADDPALDFAINLQSIRDRLDGLGYFVSVTDILDASEALDQTLPGLPPAAFVGVTSERAERNDTIGGHYQRVRVEIGILFVESAARFDREAKDQLEDTRRAVIRILVGFVPEGTHDRLSYARYRVANISDGLVWGEVTFTTSYRLSI
jgi:hypothetical protein